LLGVRRAALLDVVAEAGLVPIADPSNVDETYERTRWRKLMPELEGLGLTPERLALFARRAGEASDAVAAVAAAARSHLVIGDGEGDFALQRPAFLKLRRAVAVKLLADLLDEAGGKLKPHDLGAVEAIHLRLIHNQSLKPTTLHNCIIACDGDVITIGRETTPRRRGRGPAAAGPEA
jgi:tRNA(Ile)-lysidine synthase